MKRLRVLMSWQEILPETLEGATVVVLDVFLATTTLLAILENGARRVFPAESLEQAEEVSGDLAPSSLLRGGEQNAERIEGYDLGPFPAEYPPETVAGKDVVFVTTNGTRTIGAAVGAERVLIGCLRNASAVARYLESSGTDSVYLICAGSRGHFTLEDFLGAAAIISCMDTESWKLNDAAWLALDFMEHQRRNIPEALKQSRTGRWFTEHDAYEVLDFVSDVGASDLVPEVRDGRLFHVDESSENLIIEEER